MRRWVAGGAACTLLAGLIGATSVAGAEPLVTNGVYGWGDAGSEQWRLDFDNNRAPYVDVAVSSRSGSQHTTLAVTADGDVVSEGDFNGLASNMPAEIASGKITAIDVMGRGSFAAAAAISEQHGIVTWNGAPEPSAVCQQRVATQGARDVQLMVSQVPDSYQTNAGIVLLGDGTLCSWGATSTVESTPEVGGFEKIDAGGSHVVGLTETGEVYLWGINGARSLPAEFGQATVVDIAAVVNNVWALTDTGEILAADWIGRPVTPPAVPDEIQGKVVGLSESTVSSLNQMLAVTDRGEFVTWGGGVHMQAPPPDLEGHEVLAMSTSVSGHAFIAGEDLGLGPDPITVTEQPSIAGEPLVGETLTATPAEFSETEGVELTHQWYATRDAEPELIQGSTKPTLELTADQLGATITYTTTGQRGDEDPVVSEHSNAIGPIEEEEPETLEVETRPSIALAGGATEPRPGETIDATPAEFNQRAGLTIEHRWFRDGEPIDGVDGDTYELTGADVGAEIAYATHAERVSDGQTATSEQSDPIGPVLPAVLAFEEPPAINGPGYVGEEHTVVPGSTNDDDNVTMTYEWTVTFDDDRPAVTAPGETFTPDQGHLGGTLAVVQTAVRGDEAPVSATSQPVGPLREAPAPVAVESPAQIAVEGEEGIPFWGETLVGAPAVFAETEGVTVKHFWVSNLTQETPAELDEDGKARMVIPDGAFGVVHFRSVAIRDGYEERSGVSDSEWMTGFKQRIEVVSEPVVAGGETPLVGQELSIGSPAEFNLPPGTATVRHRWIAIAEDGTEEIVGTSQTLTLTQYLVGKRIVLEAHISRGAGGPGDQLTARSEPIGPITEPAPVELVTAPSIGGEPIVGQTLTGTPAEFTGDIVGEPVHEWLVNGEVAATGSTLALTRAHLGATIGYRTTVMELVSGETLTWEADTLGPVTLSPLAITGVPVVNGNPFIGQDLTVAPAPVNDEEVEPTFQWKADGTAIEGATGTTYTVQAGDAGKTITVEQIVARNGATEPGPDYASAESEPTAPVREAPVNLEIVEDASISGARVVGQTITGVPATFSDTEEATVTNFWVIDGETVPAESNELVLTDEHVGATIHFRSVANREVDGASVTSTSASSVGPVLAKVTVETEAALTGEAKVGETLTAAPATFSGGGDITVTTTWLVDGEPIEHEGLTFELTEEHEGKVIGFRSIGERSVDGVNESVESAAETTAVAPAEPVGPGPGPGPGPGGPGGPGTPEPPNAVDLEGKIEILGPNEVLPGGTLTVLVGEEYAGQQVTVMMFSGPRNLGTFTVAADGTIKVQIPSDAEPGVHRLAVYDAAGELIGWEDFTVLAPGGGAGSGTTGRGMGNFGAESPQFLAPLGLAVLLAGAVTLGAGWRRRRQLS